MPLQSEERILYAVRIRGVWYGDPDLLPEGEYEEVKSADAFRCSDDSNPNQGEYLTYKLGKAPSPSPAYLFPHTKTLHTDGTPRSYRPSQAVMDALFVSSPYTGWEV